ncbi:hypothetical protein ACO22_05142 [Paracoccidioides brasiliensis]|uniref:Protein kinase domain-containing protein n=1 Tax=Paracoccidioides brasiliensis TaxID=121759 RepID=A0A1D2JB24_PARBR|nr:hypothetical protein ACO22_05142 [Paracoccidioides brasiliensis]
MEVPIFSSKFCEGLHSRLGESPFLQLPLDTVRDQRIFVYKYMNEDFLSLVRKQILMKARKQILKANIKSDNIMINYRGTGTETIIEQVQIIDLENSAYLPKERCIIGIKPSDIFSFTAVATSGFFLGDRQELNGLMTHLGDEGVNCEVLGYLWDDRVVDYRCYKSFSEWPNVYDDKFENLIHRMTNLDLQKRATAREMLEHP